MSGAVKPRTSPSTIASVTTPFVLDAISHFPDNCVNAPKWAGARRGGKKVELQLTLCKFAPSERVVFGVMICQSTFSES